MKTSTLREGTALLIVGAPGCGKSFLVHSIAISIASSTKFLGWKTGENKIPVGILDGEMLDDLMKERFDLLSRSFKVDYNNLDISIVSRGIFSEKEKPFVSLDCSNERRVLLDSFKGVKVLIFDNINALFPNGNENDAQFWKGLEKLIHGCRDRGITPIFIHHTTKSYIRSPAGSSRNMRMIESAIALTPIPGGADSQEGAYFNFEFLKTRELTEEKPFSAKAHYDRTSKNLTWVRGEYIVTGEQDSSVINNVFALKKEGLSVRDIAKEVNLSKSKVDRILKR